MASDLEQLAAQQATWIAAARLAGTPNLPLVVATARKSVLDAISARVGPGAIGALAKALRCAPSPEDLSAAAVALLCQLVGGWDIEARHALVRALDHLPDELGLWLLAGLAARMAGHPFPHSRRATTRALVASLLRFGAAERPRAMFLRAPRVDARATLIASS